jgi:Dual specificity phosphatase, catalytic domain
VHVARVGAGGARARSAPVPRAKSVRQPLRRGKRTARCSEGRLLARPCASMAAGHHAPSTGWRLVGCEIVAWKNEGIDLVLSLLEDDEVAELGISGEQHACQDQGIEFVSFPIADRDVPRSSAETERIARRLSDELLNGKGVAIHCRAGIGRSSLIAACVLVLNGYEANSALEAISKARGLEVPDTEAQRLWASAFQAAQR